MPHPWHGPSLASILSNCKYIVQTYAANYGIILNMESELLLLPHYHIASFHSERSSVIFHCKMYNIVNDRCWSNLSEICNFQIIRCKTNFIYIWLSALKRTFPSSQPIKPNCSVCLCIFFFFLVVYINVFHTLTQHTIYVRMWLNALFIQIVLLPLTFCHKQNVMNWFSISLE